MMIATILNPTPHAWWDFGYLGVAGCVFLEQIGVPIPAFPALLAAGALSVSGEMNFALCLAIAIGASVLADSIWYVIGLSRGGKVLNLMCRLSWRPDTCVSKTKSFFSRYGTRTLLFSKFVPGLNTLAPPLAGMSNVRYGEFVAYDAVGALFWATLPLAAGAYLSESFKRLQMQAHSIEAYIPWVCGFLVVGVLIWNFIQRKRYLKALKESLQASISVEELKRMQDAGESVVVVDVRDELDARANPITLPHSRWIPHDTIENHFSELPLDKTIVVFCDCPAEQTAGSVAEFLREKGAKQVRPLVGGLNGWRSKGFEMVPMNFDPAI
ncbi:MAG TPA: VTT domain-containing protein [Verrucomicrobiae bacterium]|jgi:membrane protein DedA with SNARE-associated domain/rhodanese-related sulfurtransferase|nr:VTT domain-containing protein [Verrucomicrobiae bacterium]